MKIGTLYLIPSPLGDGETSHSIPEGVAAVATKLRHFIVEEVRTARRYLKKLDKSFPIEETTFRVLNEHTRDDEISSMLDPASNGSDIGLMSEAGLPGIADPGAKVVAIAHRRGIKVRPLAGPSSLLLAVAASGLNGQSFAFHGYLPVKATEREKKIRDIEVRSKSGESQVFIETPYRNLGLFNSILKVCSPSTALCIAAGLTTEREYIETLFIKDWKHKNPPFDKLPAVFILQG